MYIFCDSRIEEGDEVFKFLLLDQMDGLTALKKTSIKGTGTLWWCSSGGDII